jgi:hypothetical protein
MIIDLIVIAGAFVLISGTIVLSIKVMDWEIKRIRHGR